MGNDRAFRTGWSVVKAPFEDHAWAQGSPHAEGRYNQLVDQMGMEGADEAYSDKDLVELMTGIKQMVEAAEGGMSGMSTRNAYGAYLGLIPQLAESLRTHNQGAATYLLMAGANKQGVMDAMRILEGQY